MDAKEIRGSATSPGDLKRFTDDHVEWRVDSQRGLGRHASNEDSSRNNR
jgi:hypothetical protein